MHDLLIPRPHLFGHPDRFGGMINSNGALLAWVAPLEGVANVWVAPVSDPSARRPITQDRGRGIQNYHWAYDGIHVVYLQDDDGDENWRLFAVNIQTGAAHPLTPKGARATLAGISRRVRDEVLVSINARDSSYPDLFRVELASGRMVLVFENLGFAGLLADEWFRPRLATQSTPSGGLKVLRLNGRSWETWFHILASDVLNSGLSHLSADGTQLFLRDSSGRDTAALIRMDLVTGERYVLAEDARADIGGLLTDAETYQPVAYAVLVERLSYHALDPFMQPDLDFLTAQNIGDWSLQSRTEDDRLWVVTASSDLRPGVAYLYDRADRSLRLLYHTRSGLAGTRLSPMRHTTIAARDGLPLICYLTLPREITPVEGPAPAPAALILLVHGGPWARLGFGYNAMHQWLANRGYRVLSINFRGSTGLGKQFVNAGNHEWGRRMDEDLQDAVAWAVAQGIADPARIAIMGSSYGGYAVLAAMTRSPELYACGVDVAGPSNLETFLATVPPYWKSFRAQLINAVGDPDTEQGRMLLRERSPVHQAGQICRPLLIAQGANDPRVKQTESDQIAAAIWSNGVPVTYLLFPDEGHGFVRPENVLAFVAVAEAFLARHLGGRVDPITMEERTTTTMQVVYGADLIGD